MKNKTLNSFSLTESALPSAYKSNKFTLFLIVFLFWGIHSEDCEGAVDPTNTTCEIKRCTYYLNDENTNNSICLKC